MRRPSQKHFNEGNEDNELLPHRMHRSAAVVSIPRVVRGVRVPRVVPGEMNTRFVRAKNTTARYNRLPVARSDLSAHRYGLAGSCRNSTHFLRRR